MTIAAVSPTHSIKFMQCNQLRYQCQRSREREDMDLLAVGNSMKNIGDNCQIGLPTCSKHRTKLLSQLKVANDVELVRRLLLR